MTLLSKANRIKVACPSMHCPLHSRPYLGLCSLICRLWHAIHKSSLQDIVFPFLYCFCSILNNPIKIKEISEYYVQIGGKSGRPSGQGTRYVQKYTLMSCKPLIYNKHHKVSSHVKVNQNTHDSVRHEII